MRLHLAPMPSAPVYTPDLTSMLSAPVRMSAFARDHRYPRNAGIRADLLFSTPATIALIHTFADFFKGKGKGSRGLIWIHLSSFDRLTYTGS